MRGNLGDRNSQSLWVALMCDCEGNGYVKVALPQGVPFHDNATVLRICPTCRGHDSMLEKALSRINMTVEQYFERK